MSLGIGTKSKMDINIEESTGSNNISMLAALPYLAK
jgi:hypothetical protein